MFDKVWAHSKRVALLESVLHLAEWDMEVYMPKKAADARAEQIELLASLVHQEKSDPTFIENVHSLKDLEPWQQAAKREWLEEIRKATSLPNEFVKAFAKLTSEALIVWREARKESQFKKFAPYLQKIVEMNRQKAEYLGYEDSPYDALMDLYEPKMTVKTITPLFQGLAKEIAALLEQIPKWDNSCLKKEITESKQLAFGKALLETIGYDFQHGRLDLSTHPFSTSMHPHDNRITTRISSHSFFDSLSAIIHEAGHGFYEMQLDPDYFGTPIGESRSLGVHESQSRFWETLIGQSLPFWRYFFPKLQKEFDLKDVTLQTFYQAINRVSPSLIRVEADEVTYSLHVILRFELEKELIEGKMKVNEIPEAWNAKMRSYLGIVPKADREGCLQDIHWSMGAFGYFATYALGTIYAAQFFESFAREHPDWDKRVASGEFRFILDWQREKIHRWGKMYSTEELVKRITNKGITTLPYLSYLKGKYLS